ncbi:MAG: DUF3780 domain-containing protein [Chloroflexi bacterium]|nr:DUF3780 domain-containing protein [Chloroflexota bacterium]
MAERNQKPSPDVLVDTFGFDPNQSVSHFLVHIPAGTTQPITISEHLSWDPDRIADSVHYGERLDGQVKSQLDRPKWNAVADLVRAEFNLRLKREGKRPGRWKAGYNTVSRMLGKELTLLTWALEDADPALIPTAVANWRGLTPEERWWLYTMTAAATGSYADGRGRGWRKAVRFALTENPVSDRPPDQPIVPEFFRLVSQSMSESDQLTAQEGTAHSSTGSARKSRKTRRAKAANQLGFGSDSSRSQ